ncbi:MAG: flavodoxin domain-containing protein [Planctomycetota bacterium]|nr:flavodoxin domain-containing protein [Planctomycetota bacterium]
MTTELKKGVFWVGAVDWGLRLFHGHELSTHRGSTYNSYLIVDKKVALVDAVWGPFTAELIENIKEIIDPAKIDIVVANHSESDHSGALPEVMRLAPNATLVVSKRGAESIEGHYHRNWKYTAMKTGDKLDLGANSLVFVEAPMLHWPDSMFTYLTGHNILMPNDAFGQHYATAFRFNDEVDQAELYEEALKYYANILTPFSAQVAAKIKDVLALNLPVDIIAPSHGVIWRKDPLQIVHRYQEWAAQKPEQSAVILYGTIWQGTRRMADAIGEGFAEAGVPYKIVDVAVSDRNDAITDIFRARTVVLGSSTMNQNVVPSIHPLLGEIKGLKFKNKIGAAFGCYGWSGESVKLLEEHLTASGIPVACPGLKCKWQPSAEELEACRKFGRALADATKKPGSPS